MDDNKIKKWGITAAVILIGAIFLYINSPIVFIQSHQRGLKFTMGAISNDILQPGLNFRVPILQSIEKVDIRPIELTGRIEVGPNGAITLDNQTIGVLYQTFYVYDQTKLVSMWKDYGQAKLENLITTSIEESLKATVGQYTIFEVPGIQDKLKNQTIQMAKSKLSPYPITLTEVRVTNYDWSDEFDKQIAATMTKAQQVKQKEQELKMKEFESQKQVVEALAHKQAVIAKAEGTKAAVITQAEGKKEAAKLEAEAKALEGEGIKKFNESIRATQDIEIKLRELEIAMNQVQKWNGQYVPTNNYGPIPLETGGLQGK